MQIERLNRLPKVQQKVAMQILDGVLSRSNREHTAVLAPPGRASDTPSLAHSKRRSYPMNAQAVEALIERLKSLPPEQRAEVEDFVDFLKTRTERAHDAAARRLAEAFKRLDALNQPPFNPEEVEAEIDAARVERRARHADRR
jgi:hypothetical protein